MMEVDVSWQGVSGVPGLGCSVENCYKSSSLLKLWEEENDEQRSDGEKISLSGRIVKFFSFRRKKNEQKQKHVSKYSSVSLPTVSVRRSLSAVTTSNRIKVNPKPSDESYQTVVKTNSSNNRRSVSLQRVKKKERERECECEPCLSVNCAESDKQSLRRSETLNVVKHSRRVNLHSLPTCSASGGQSVHRKLIRASPTQTLPDRKDHLKKCQATQTDMLKEGREEEDYDYVYSNCISPVMIIKLSEKVEESEEEDANIYEENIPQEREMTKTNPLFLSISRGRRKQLEMYRFADWDLDMEMNRRDKMGKMDITEKDNYIKPQAIKEEIEKEILKRNISLHRRKTKENRNVTFADDDKKLQRSKSVNVTKHRLLNSDL